MIELPIPGVFLIEQTSYEDSRGTFNRLTDDTWLPQGISIIQTSFSRSKKIGTLRGLHYQKSKTSEYKIISVVQGSVYDVLVDLRNDSKNRNMCAEIELSKNDYKALLIPPGVAHGFQTLEEETLLFYAMTSKFDPKNYFGVRWNDPSLNIKWPMSPTMISNQDNSWPLIKE